MIRRLLLVLMTVAAITLIGCDKKEPPMPPEPQVTPENLDTELDKMEADIEADIAAEQ